MSSILYPLGYYKFLERQSRLANHLFFECRGGHGRELNLETTLLSEFLFELNYDAYAFRYAHHSDTADDLKQARECTLVEPEEIEEDSDWGQVKDWNNIPQIWKLLSRIRYQCEEFPQGHPAERRFDVLRWMVDEAVKMQMEKLNVAIKSQLLPRTFYSFVESDR